MNFTASEHVLLQHRIWMREATLFTLNFLKQDSYTVVKIKVCFKDFQGRKRPKNAKPNFVLSRRIENPCSVCRPVGPLTSWECRGGEGGGLMWEGEDGPWLALRITAQLRVPLLNLWGLGKGLHYQYSNEEVAIFSLSHNILPVYDTMIIQQQNAISEVVMVTADQNCNLAKWHAFNSDYIIPTMAWHENMASMTKVKTMNKSISLQNWNGPNLYEKHHYLRMN